MPEVIKILSREQKAAMTESHQLLNQIFEILCNRATVESLYKVAKNNKKFEQIITDVSIKISIEKVDALMEDQRKNKTLQ